MPAQSKILDPVFEIDEVSKKIRCKACFEADPINTGWMVRGSAKRHIEESRDHTTNIENNGVRRRSEAVQRDRLAAAYSASSYTDLDSGYQIPGPSSRPDFGNSLANTMDNDDNNIFNIFDNLIIPADIEPFAEYSSLDEKERLRREVELLMMQAEQDDFFGLAQELEDDATITNVTESLRSVEISSDMADDVQQGHFAETVNDGDYAPYPNKVTMLLDILDNLPRLRMSSSQFRMILWLLKECRVNDVPSFHSFRKLQQQLRTECGNEPTMHTSSVGNIFYVNDVRQSIAQDFANPEIVKHLEFYPEETDGPISEVWQAARWKEFKPCERTPMYASGLKHFYVDEVCALSDGQIVIPLAWIKRGGQLCADCYLITTTEGSWQYRDHTIHIVPAHLFERTYLEIATQLDGIIPWSVDTIDVPHMPNALRKLADDEELYVVMLPLWCDDVSGNRSKQYNKHINMYMANSNLPGRLLQQEYFVRFVATSPHATSPEQFSAVMAEIKATHTNPIRCFKADTHTRVRVMLRVPCLPADNPQQSEEASHMGGNANCKSRKSTKGGPHDITESDEGYHELYTPGPPRCADVTRAQIHEQIQLAMRGFAAPIEALQTATGTKDKIAQYWIDILIDKARQLKSDNSGRSRDDIAEELGRWFKDQPGDKINPLLLLDGLDPSQDTPVEILHTILLGITKYVWHNLHTSWNETQQNLFVIRLQSTDIDGLSVPPIRSAYMMQYRNGLIGKHFKTLMQTMVFHVHDIVSSEQFVLIKAIGSLGALLWVPEIENMDSYLNDLEILIGNVLDAFALIDPSKIIDKMKLQILPNLIDDIRRFGPAIRYSTEIFECYNAIFRLCSVLSNHQAPSRDIANKFASMDRLKHILSGGYWETEDGWVRAGPKVRTLLHNDPFIQRHLGWVPSYKPLLGYVKPKAKAKNAAIAWDETKASSQVTTPVTLGYRDSFHWHSGEHVIAQSGDECAVGSWVFVSHNEKIVIGRIFEILAPETPSPDDGVVTVEIFELSTVLHPDFDMPMLRRTLENCIYCTVHSKALHFKFSAQHDCRTGRCHPSALRAQMQERQETSRTLSLIAHEDDGHFVINMHALHNATHLRKLLPRDLITPKPLYADRKARHYEISTGLRVTQAEKRARTAAKAKATREANKKKKQHPKQATVIEEQESDRESDAGGEPDIQDEADQGRGKRRRVAH